MAALAKAISKNLFDIFPTFGGSGVHIPAWDNGQKMFIYDEYESAKGNRYYPDFCERLVMVEKVGLCHNRTYIDSIVLYAFNDKNPELIQKRNYNRCIETKSYEEFIRSESECMIKDYFAGILKDQRSSVLSESEEAERQSKALIEE